jgi:hypothetical protein
MHMPANIVINIWNMFIKSLASYGIKLKSHVQSHELLDLEQVLTELQG